MGLVIHLVKDESQRQVQVQDFAEGKNIIGGSWISRFLDQYPILSLNSPVASTVSVLMQAILVINDHFAKLGKVLRTNRKRPKH